MRWGLACLLALTARRLGLPLSLEGTPLAPASGESLEAWLLREATHHQPRHMDTILVVIENGKPLGDREADLSRRVLQRLGRTGGPGNHTP